MQLSFELIALLFTVALLAGFVDAAAGGGGLIVVPALLLTGMSPAQALATNKLQGSAGSLSASLTMIKKASPTQNHQNRPNFGVRWLVCWGVFGAIIAPCIFKNCHSCGRGSDGAL